MSNIQGYFLYFISSDRHSENWFVYPYKVFMTLQGAKNAKIIKDTRPGLNNSAWLIVPIYFAYDRKCKVKYMFLDGQWTTELDDKIANAFYKWRGFDSFDDD